MPLTTPACHFSKALSDYLRSPLALEYGVPATATVQRRHLLTTGPITNPNLLIESEADPGSSDTLITVSVRLVLTVQLGLETGQTTEEQAQLWLQTFRSLLSPDIDAVGIWDAWTQTLTNPQKDGWYVQSIWPQPTERELDEATGLLRLISAHQVVSYWND